jgi:hypothetical protein
MEIIQFHEPWADNYIFMKLDELFVDPLYKLGFTPNMVTLFEFIFFITNYIFFIKR